MTVKKIDLGPTGMTVARNIRQFREDRRLGYAELSRLLAAHKREIPPLGLRRVEAGARRVDADDIVALALALNVSPLALLLPTEDSPLVPQSEPDSVERIWLWGKGQRALPLSDDPIAFVRTQTHLDGVN